MEMAYQFLEQIPTLFNDHSQIPPRPPQLPPYPQYRRVKRVPPFYKKRTFWIYTGGGGFLLTVYYVNHLEVVPISNRRRFMDVTPKQEAKLAQQAYSEIMRRYHHNILPSWDHRTRFVRAVAQQIIRVSGMEDLKWEVHVIDSPEKNAFVLPGGKIFVFTGILPIVENQHGLAAVLGHEVSLKIEAEYYDNYI
ncbi:2635_t:CDS:2 [Cetraspora pellucida]|uniref:2635_t:CDS:1 n=1 Tax=Cetraspora pellucida TaxID=1433469 RepID=A0ACA9L2A9_9GLOM|nr:2635_t:CDS:2 [Cetraspora pellucida]